jgi:uncharacterized damage-inducible protein DinB
MENTERNMILDRLFRHMAWANNQFLTTLSTLPAESYGLSLPHDDWTVGAISQHFVRSAGGYATALDKVNAGIEVPLPKQGDDYLELVRICAIFDARLREAATLPDEKVARVRDGVTIFRARSTIVSQSIHHATEHRAQIASILSLHQVTGVDLDDLDVWAYGDAEGLGN